MQSDQLQNITGQLNEVYGGGYINVSGAFYDTGESAGLGGGSSGWNPRKIGFDASRVARTGAETRPVNFTIRVWRRIA